MALPKFPQLTDTQRQVIPYFLVVLAAWVGAGLFADQAVQQTGQDRYEADVAACERGNLTVRAPLGGFASAVLSEDELSADVHRAAEQLARNVIPVDCEQVVNAP